ncbi:type IV secretion system protein [Sphingomonas sp. PB2P12]|uniref:type IV secretion system protein n=1 Tax=Sphingomonas sandaracina TaxID=3096157 RepID=UPI002FC9ED61
MAVCQTIPAAGQFASGLIGYIDCQAVNLGSQGYAALAASGSTASLLLVALLTIYIAIMGYRMLLGEMPSLREGVVSFVKIGIVLALATSWPAYHTVIYDVVLRTPGELAGEIGGVSELPGATGGLSARLDGVDEALRTLSIYGVGTPLIDPAAQDPAQRIEPSLWAGFDTFALGAARIVFLGTAAGGFALTRLTAGFLLALGPLFIAFLLFAGTRGLFEGWLRALIGAALGALVTAILLGIELGLLEPWLTDLVGLRASGIAIPGVPATLLATTLVFGSVLAGLLVVTARIAHGLRLPAETSHQSADRQRDTSSTFASSTTTAAAPGSAPTPSESRTRAVAVADAVAATQRREAAIGGPGSAAAGSSAMGSRSGSVTAASAGGPTSGTPIGQRFQRRTTTRISASSRLRDRRA